MAIPTILVSYIIEVVALIFAWNVIRRRQTHRRLPLPPGPRPLPFIGNLLDMPTEKNWLTYCAWHNQYGDVVSVNVLGQNIVILGNATAVTDLMERRNAIYSDRPITPMVELMKMDWALPLHPYDESWRRKRKLLHSHVHQGAVDRYYPIQVASARRLARDIIAVDTTPEALSQLVRLNFVQTMIKAVYAIEVDSYDNEHISLSEKMLKDFSEAGIPGRFLVDFIPALKYVPTWFPGASFQRMAQKNHATQQAVRDSPIDMVKSQMANGIAPPSMARTMLEEDASLPSHQSQLELIKDVTAVAYLAGIDTTVAAVIAFFLAALIYPESQAKAQAEVDRIVGHDRLPELEDRKDMPYVEAVVNECLRWLPVLPIATPRRLAQDDQYGGYTLPKGSIIVTSTWSILQNAIDYPEPNHFKPERYLSPDGSLNPSVRNPRTACFGHGRRICPGQYIADTSLFMTVATLLATVNVVRAKDASGQEIVPEVNVTGGILSHPKPFPWSVHSRSRRAEELLATGPTASADNLHR